jgi:hypothetical protein
MFPLRSERDQLSTKETHHAETANATQFSHAIFDLRNMISSFRLSSSRLLSTALSKLA